MAPKLSLPDGRASYLLWYADICLTELAVDIDERDSRGQVKAAERQIMNAVNAQLRELRQLGVAAYDRGFKPRQAWEDVGDVLLRLITRPERAGGLLTLLDAERAGPSMRERRTLRLAATTTRPDDDPEPPKRAAWQEETTDGR
jgi:hypothetical protein